MNTKKGAFFTVIVVAVGIVILPNFVLHIEEEWKEIPAPTPATGEELPATPIPGVQYQGTAAGVMEEIQVGSAHRNFSCDTCHYSPLADFDFHVECMDCHGDTGNISGHWEYLECMNCSLCHWSDARDINNYTDFISAGGFGMNATPFDVGGLESHTDFILAAMNNPQMAGANEACIACHTDANVSVTLPKRKYMTFKAGMDNASSFGEEGMV